MVSTACQFAHWFSHTVAHDLEEARGEDHQWRETSWTDRMLLELKRLHDPHIVVRGSNERVTHADMEWWFVGERRATYLCITMQAKILHYTQKDPKSWLYGEIAHPSKSQGRQAIELVKHAERQTRAGRAMLPLYLFYNPSAVDTIDERTARIRGAGVMLAFARDIRNHLLARKTGKAVPINAKRFVAIRPFQFPLSSLLCLPGDIPGPAEVAGRLNRIDEIFSRFGPRRPASKIKVDVGRDLPRDICRIMLGERAQAIGDDEPRSPVPDRVFFRSDLD